MVIIDSITELEFYQGALNFIFVMISGTVGAIIASKYRKNKQKELLAVGISSICQTSPWWSSAFFQFIDDTGGEVSIPFTIASADVTHDPRIRITRPPV